MIDLTKSLVKCTNCGGMFTTHKKTWTEIERVLTSHRKRCSTESPCLDDQNMRYPGDEEVQQ